MPSPAITTINSIKEKPDTGVSNWLLIANDDLKIKNSLCYQLPPDAAPAATGERRAELAKQPAT